LISTRIGPTTDPETVTRPDRGRKANPMACGPLSRSATIKRKGGGRGTDDEVHRAFGNPPKNPNRSNLRALKRREARRLCTELRRLCITCRHLCWTSPPPQLDYAVARLRPRPRLRLDFFIAMANNGDAGTSIGGTASNPPLSLLISRLPRKCYIV
jgi:hypothetical protein